MTKRCPNTFNHPDWTRAVSAHLPGAITAKVPATGMARLTATLKRKRWPVAHADSWITPLGNSGLPASAVEPAPEDIMALLEAAETPVVFRNLPLDHPTTQQLLQAATSKHILQHWRRAALNLTGSFENWLQTNFDQKRRKELKRLRARLAEQGDLVSLSLQPNADFRPFFEAFLQLEAESWKGKRGTALANSPETARALEAGLSVMHSAGRLKFWQINVNGKPIAALFALTDDGEVALGKIAHADSHAKYSPGVLIILDATAELLAAGIYTQADSNAMPGHPMIDRIWRDRVECVDVLLAGPSTPTTVFKTLSVWLGIKSALKNTVKRAMTQYSGRKSS